MLKDWNRPERPSDEEIDTRLKIARENLTRNQIKVKEGKIPVFVIFEGWGAAGKGSLVGRIIKNMDPRFFNVESGKTQTIPVQVFYENTGTGGVCISGWWLDEGHSRWQDVRGAVR